jgi:hypothetical protein
MMKVREPRLHQRDEAEPLRRQVAETYGTLLDRGTLRPIVTLAVLTAVIVQVMLEFGPLWMVALAASAALYGPHWAGLTAALGLGGLLGGRLSLTRPATVGAIAAAIVACSVTLTTSHVTAAVVAAQVILVLLVVAMSIPITKRLHDAIPSSVRAGVASGVGTLTWVAFLPIALVFGAISDRAGVHDAGWTVVAVTVAAAAVLTVTVGTLKRAPAGLPLPPPFPADRFLPADDPEWPGHWARPPLPWPDVEPADPATRIQVQTAVNDLPSPQREVLVLRDIHGLTVEQVSDALDVSEPDQRALLNQARGELRRWLDQHLEGRRR